jgi:hypothetical protein
MTRYFVHLLVSILPPMTCVNELEIFRLPGHHPPYSFCLWEKITRKGPITKGEGQQQQQQKKDSGVDPSLRPVSLLN